MTAKRRKQWISALVDLLTVNLAVGIFNPLRLLFNRAHGVLADTHMITFLTDPTIIAEQLFFPLAMLALYWLSGYYATAYGSSRMKDLTNSAGNALTGTILFFLTAMLNDVLPMRRYSYELMLMLFLTLTVCVTAGRWILSTSRARRKSAGLDIRPALVIGTSPKAVALARRIENARKVMGLGVTGFVSTGGEPVDPSITLPVSSLDELPSLIADNGIDAIIVAAEASSPETLKLVNRLLPLDVSVMLWPDSTLPSLARRSFTNVAGEPLVDVSRPPMNPAQINLKRVIDVVVSALALTVLSPLLAALAVAVRADSPGPVFYRQRRLGFHRRPFNIVKFRSMKVDAESASGPALSTPDDPRITRVGRIMRKYRLDELPNFWNVLRGDMSLVGPRPEREHFLARIMERAPQCALLHRVRPGITSWGMVKFGYAQTVDEMVERLRYDLIYVENVSLSVDAKILFYTVHTVITGKGI